MLGLSVELRVAELSVTIVPLKHLQLRLVTVSLIEAPEVYCYEAAFNTYQRRIGIGTGEACRTT